MSADTDSNTSATDGGTLDADAWASLLADVDGTAAPGEDEGLPFRGDLVDDLSERLNITPDEADSLIDEGVAAGVVAYDDALNAQRLTLADGVKTNGADEPDAEDADEDADTVSGTSGTETTEPDIMRERAAEALDVLVDYYHAHVDDAIDDHQEGAPHSDRPDTARDYFRARGWSDETIDRLRLGWAPPNDRGAVEHLRDAGFNREEILATGAFSESLQPLNHGRYMLPYPDADGSKVEYLIGRCTDDGPTPGGGAAGYGGHPEDFMAGKYTKLAHTKPYAYVSEPIWGRHTLREGVSEVIIAEGIADAIAADAAGYAVLSPVAKDFKREHLPGLEIALEEHGVERVYVIPDAETAEVSERERDDDTEPTRISDALTLPTTPPGIGGGLRTAALLREAGFDALVVDLPRLASTAAYRKTDLDDYVHGVLGGSSALAAAMASAREPEAYAEYQAATASIRTRRDPSNTQASTRSSSPARGEAFGSSEGEWSGEDFDGEGRNTSALWDLGILDVTPAEFGGVGDRGKNPLGHFGTSEAYFVIIESPDEGRSPDAEPDLLAKDYKRPGDPVYNALTYLVIASQADGIERTADRPNGPLTDHEVFVAWREARDRGLLPEDDPIPSRALAHIAIDADLCEPEDIEDGWKLPFEAFNGALEELESRGIEHGREPLGVSAPSGGNSRSLSPEQFIETCEPPLDALTAEPVDVAAAREEMAGDGYDRMLDHGGLSINAHPPGTGKTTTTVRAADDRDRESVTLLPTHANAREFQLDDAKPDAFHLKGSEQPAEDDCMDAKIGADDGDGMCDEHGHPSECPKMCPVYNQPSDSAIRRSFDELAGYRGVAYAHKRLSLSERSWHGKTCEWTDQWTTARGAQHIVTVSQYLTQDTVRGHGDVILDDVSGVVSDHDLEPATIGRVRQELLKTTRSFESQGDTSAAAACEVLCEWLDDLHAALTTADDARSAYAELPVPAFRDAGALTEIVEKEYVGQESQYVSHREESLAETLARVKLEYDERIISRMVHGRYNGAPLAMTEVLGALATVADTNDDTETAHGARLAAAFETELEVCPSCDEGVPLDDIEGRRVCPKCGWDEDDLASSDGTRLITDMTVPSPARIDASVATDADGDAILRIRRLPAFEELPAANRVIINDATPKADLYAAMFGTTADTIHVEGDAPYSLPHAHVTQFIDGAYHRGTIVPSEDDDDEGDDGDGDEESKATPETTPAQRKLQRAIDKIAEMHDSVVYVASLKARDAFDFPMESCAGVYHYYALRGLDAAKNADAIVLVGAPHPNESDLRAEARLLGIDNPWVRVGGDELSTRDGRTDDPSDDPGPPVYRKLRYVDEDGKGRAVASKTYTGMTGRLFDSRHADELEQAAHRIRPVLADEDAPKHVYMLTNVATELPIDTLTTFDAFHNPLSTLDVRDSALKLLDAMVESATDDATDEAYATDGGLLSVAGTASEWHDAAKRAGLDVSQPTVSRGLKDLRDAGLVAEGDYAHRRGRLHRLTRKGASVAAIARTD